jgi:hypothetical protein
MTKKNLTILVICLFVSFVARAQKSAGYEVEKPAQTFYGELGGAGLFTVNYDQRFKGNDGFGVRAGVGGFGFLKKGVFTIPIGVNYLTGSGNNYAELGAGFCSVSISNGNTYFDNTSSTIVGFINFGYRYQPQSKGLTARVFISPLFTAAGIVPFYGGVSAGIKF